MRAVHFLALAGLTCMVPCGCQPQANDAPAVRLPGGLEPASKPASETPGGVGGLQSAVPAPVVAAKKANEFWTKEEVETWVRQDLKLAQVNLTPQPDHGFSGTGLGLNGRNYTLTIKQIPGGIKCSFQDDFGGSGNMAFGTMAEAPKPFQPVERPRSDR